MIISEQQKRIIEAREPKIVVTAAAASGKTRALTERVRYLHKVRNIPASEIVVVTFTVAAAQEMKMRLGADGSGIFIGTIHALAYQYLVAKGFDVSQQVEEEKFDELFNLVKENPWIIPHITCLLVDEIQDTSKIQFEFLLDLLHPQEYTFFGDLRQCIYSFRDADPQFVIDLIHSPDVTVYDLNENYRNGQQIINYAARMLTKLPLSYQDHSRCMRNCEGTVYELFFSYERILDLVSRDTNYKNWFILCRTNQEVNDVYYYLTRHKIPCDTFKRAELSNAELSQKMEENTVKVLTIHAAKGLERLKVIVIGNKYYNDEEIRISYVAATRAMDELYIMKPKPKYKKKQYSSWE